MHTLARMRARLIAGMLVLVAAVVLVIVRLGGLQGVPMRAPAQHRPAPALAGIDGWVNSDPLTLEQLRGRVVLLDFWTYTCINCVRTFPFLRALDQHYAAAGLQILGVHSPEFSFERELDNIREAANRNLLTYPIASDPRMETWRAFRNNYWPRVYLIDVGGVIRFDHIGEGGEDEIEATVRELLAETGATLPPPLGFRERGASAHITPEVYAGHQRGSVQGALASPEGYRPGEVVVYRAPDPAAVERVGARGAFFLEGPWRAEAEHVEAAGPGARLTLRFRARDVFFVAAPAAGEPAVAVLLDGRPVGAAAGESVHSGSVVIDRSDIFTIVRLDSAETHTLTLLADEGFRLFTFTFG